MDQQQARQGRVRWRLRRRLGVAASVLVLAVVAAVGLAGAPATAADAERAELLALVTAALESAPDELQMEPEALARLSDDALMAIPVRHETRARFAHQLAGAGNTDEVGVNCYSNFDGFEVSYKNVFGSRLASYFAEIRWCGNGTTITSTTSYRSWGEVYGVGWTWEGVQDNWSSGGVGRSYWTRGSQGKFCVGAYIGCATQRLPWIEATVYGNANSNWRYGG